MSEPVKTRTYSSPARARQAEKTRAAVLVSARRLFVARGYSRTTMQQIADGAGVNVDTIYQAVGRKPDVMRELIETSISGRATAVPAQQRGYVQDIRAASTAGQKIDIYAAAIVEIQQRMAPIFLALRDAATTDDACRSLWDEISSRRARNMLELAADLRHTGELRDDLDDQQVADIIWSTNSAEYWVLLVVERGWSPAQFEEHLADAWRRLLLQG